MYQVVYRKTSYPFDRLIEYETDDLVKAVKMKMDLEFQQPAPAGFKYSIQKVFTKQSRHSRV